MWEVSLYHRDEGFLHKLECSADTLLEAAQALSKEITEPYYLNDLSCRGTEVVQ